MPISKDKDTGLRSLKYCKKILPWKNVETVYVEFEDVTSSDRIQSKLGYECLLAFNIMKHDIKQVLLIKIKTIWSDLEIISTLNPW